MLDLVSAGPCHGIRFEPWNAAAGRYFAAYATRGGFRSLIGHPVIDEFATLSSPVLIGPSPWLGKLYDVGISLGHRRDPEMGLDLGWPPLCIGLDREPPRLPSTWQEDLLAALMQPFSPDRVISVGAERRQGRLGGWRLERVQVGEATVLVTDAPLLPKQLHRLCDAAGSEMVVAVSTGNRLERLAGGEARTVRSLSEVDLPRLQAAFRELMR